jgi:ankyrin repeat protein
MRDIRTSMSEKDANEALLEAKNQKQLEKALVDGAKIDATNEDGATKLTLLCKSKSGVMSKTEEAMALFLVGKGADLHNEDDDGGTPLHYAAGSGNHALIEVLLKKGVKPVASKKLKYTPLHYCVDTHAKDTWIWDTLLAAGNPLDAVNKWGETPLYAAQSSWNPTAVKYFLAKGASTTHKDSDGKTLLERATELKQDKILKLLK